ncbi:hypothetical protein FSP39_016904 [Pinctada imbricata]|uniref:EGF domain-specific O-linked N-acetylglucosamine transferase n=1 Tax=Pinctada imbricata TaxID=66713 RepID=A0AA89C1L5_PINIB|nr:hypothetical protein FSP39_016904 [Pinctada imbricata]
MMDVDLAPITWPGWNQDHHPVVMEIGEELDCGPSDVPRLRSNFMEYKFDIPFVMSITNRSKVFNYKQVLYENNKIECFVKMRRNSAGRLMLCSFAYIFSVSYVVWLLFTFISPVQYSQKLTVELEMPANQDRLDDLALLARQNQRTPTVAKHLSERTEQLLQIFGENNESNEPMFENWKSRAAEFCDGKFVGYANRFVQTFDIIVDPNKLSGASGGEKTAKVLKQSEIKEFLSVKTGVFTLDCERVPKYKFDIYLGVTRGHMPAMLRYSVPRDKGYRRVPGLEEDENMTVVVVRYDYANLFHALNDVFNVFLLHIFLHKQPDKTNILIMDGHPEGHVDPVWKQLFKNVTRVRHLSKPVLYKNMVWNMFEKWCPLNDHNLQHVPHLDDFRNFVLSSYGIDGKPRAECSNKMSVLFVWRRNYLAHPRNPTGKIDRKIKNEDEILAVTRRKYPEFNITGADLASLDFRAQLELVANIDIIVGMHGAGLSHMLFMPYNGGLIELMQYHIPVRDIKPRLVFKTIGRWKNFSFLHWQNKDKGHDLENGYTYVPPGVILELMDQIVDLMCNQEQS